MQVKTITVNLDPAGQGTESMDITITLTNADFEQNIGRNVRYINMFNYDKDALVSIMKELFQDMTRRPERYG